MNLDNSTTLRSVLKNENSFLEINEGMHIDNLKIQSLHHRSCSIYPCIFTSKLDSWHITYVWMGQPS